MIKQLLSSKRGEGYIDIAISIVVVAMVLSVALSIFSVIVLKTQMDRITEDLIECAAYDGEFGESFDKKVSDLQAQYGDFAVSYGIPSDGRWFNSHLERVQLGDEMYVTVTFQAKLFGIEKIFPLELSTTRVGKSEQYWKIG